ncbi:MAG: beta-ketoacyl-[acyl-carrier-protein] synthase family protein [Planctomycetota bacterium]|jgi:3-oxoacyl-[acyl-carrier-protein] synthase II
MSGGRAPRIVVTGLGAVSACGWGVDSLWRGVFGPEGAVGDCTRFNTEGCPTSIAAEVDDLPPRRKRTLTIADRFGLYAADEALRAAGLGSDLSGNDAGVFFGSCTGGMFESEDWYAVERHGPFDRRTAPWLAAQQVNAPGDAVARAHGVTGPVETVSSACSSATLALALAHEALVTGETTLALAGGADSLCRVTYFGFNALRAVDPEPTRPFREGRNGLSLGEGAGVLVLETLENALARGAEPLAELLAVGVSADSHHMTAPHPQGRGAAQALRAALGAAGVAPGDIDFVNAHGTGTPLNDVAEFAALAAVLGDDRARSVPVTSTKGTVGHLLGSAGALEAVATVLCLQHQEVHPTPGAGEVDADAPVRLVRPGVPLRGELDVAASLNLGFGGSNGAALFRRWRTS